MTDGGFGTLIPVGRMMDGFFWPGRTRPRKEKKFIFVRQWRGQEGQSDRTFPPHGPHNSTWTRGGGRHEGVNLDFQGHVMNCESSRNLPTGCHGDMDRGCTSLERGICHGDNWYRYWPIIYNTEECCCLLWIDEAKANIKPTYECRCNERL